LADWLVRDDFASSRLVDLFPNHEATPTDFDNSVWLLYTSRSYVPKRVRAFVEFIKQRIGGVAPGLDAPAGLAALPTDSEALRSAMLRDAQSATYSLV
jgi:hypothetical protein